MGRRWEEGKEKNGGGGRYLEEGDSKELLGAEGEEGGREGGALGEEQEDTRFGVWAPGLRSNELSGTNTGFEEASKERKASQLEERERRGGWEGEGRGGSGRTSRAR